MALKTITKKVLSYCEIPEEIKKPNWLEESSCNCYIECHYDDTDKDDELSMWIAETYPELKEENSFFIYIDY